ncbi:Hypothetical protein SMAX5B_005422 [Scophthalmus maximus]|uniref:Uncharacterized protein n=1 Tax=Scophthalmus maximus TaxID=52904 RepID=A0A2U9B221_SCOMX|nr:Hypothetical protein SMAX5B_005422 [Scophthalmus maximus]
MLDPASILKRLAIGPGECAVPVAGPLFHVDTKLTFGSGLFFRVALHSETLLVSQGQATTGVGVKDAGKQMGSCPTK